MGVVERFVALGLRQRLFVLLCVAALVVTGVVAYRDLPVEALPDLTNNQVVVITEHVTKKGEPKLVEKCAFPLTGVGCITRIYTSHAVIDVDKGRFVLREKLAAMTLEELQAMTGAKLHIDGPVADLVVPEL